MDVSEDELFHTKVKSNPESLFSLLDYYYCHFLLKKLFLKLILLLYKSLLYRTYFNAYLHLYI